MATQRTLDEYLGSGFGKPVRVSGFQRDGPGSRMGSSIRELVMCLKPDPRPRSVLVCGSLENALGEVDSYLELGVVEAAGLLCKGGCLGAGAVILRLEDVDLGDKWWRLLVFWTIRSLPQRVRVVLVLPGLARFIEGAGGERVLPLKPGGEWSWLVTLVTGKIGVCWEAFV